MIMHKFAFKIIKQATSISFIQGKNTHNQKESFPLPLQRKELQMGDCCNRQHSVVPYLPTEAFLPCMQPSLGRPS